jgi:hypothetical protein
MTTGTKTSQGGKALSARTPINEFNTQVHAVAKPQTIVIPELFNFAERNNILLARSVLRPECGWLFVPARATKNTWKLEFDPPGVLYLPDRANRLDQMEAMRRIGDFMDVHEVRRAQMARGEA